MPCAEEQTSVWPEARVPPQSSRRPLSSRWPPRCKREDQHPPSLSLNSRKQTPAPISFLFASRPGSRSFALHGGQPAKAQHHHHPGWPPVHLLNHQQTLHLRLSSDQLHLPTLDTQNYIADIAEIHDLKSINLF